MNSIYKTLASILSLLLWANVTFNQPLTSPHQHFGFQPGTDRMLFGYEKMTEYFTLLESQSGRVKTFTIGTSTMGRPIQMVCISSEENIKNIEQLKQINKRLALENTLSTEEVYDMKKQGRVFILGTLSMHSTEVGPSQSAPLVAYKLANAQGRDTLEWLRNVVYMMVPCHNPDGMNLINENYNKNKGTKYETANMPGLYHKYAGHNINRDFVILTQVENKAISRLTSTEWFPQVMVEKHQMGATGVRYFVPPFQDPIAQNIDESLWGWIGIFGAGMLNDMTTNGHKGIAQRSDFDNYWPGSTETCLWKNVISLLTEAASVNTASPIYVEKNELRVSGMGLSEYKKGVNLIAPWEGGWWQLSDIIAYELSSTFSLLKTAAINREAILQNRNDICKKETSKGKNAPPYYYILPSKQHDRSELANLMELLREHGVSISQLTSNITIDNRLFNKGDIVIPLAQPFRAFVKEVMETQKYPERRLTPKGDIIKPYDITSWSLPLLLGLECHEINSKSTELEQNITIIENFAVTTLPSSVDEGNLMVFEASCNESYKVAFSVLQQKGKVQRLKTDVNVGDHTLAEGDFVIEKSQMELVKKLGLNVSPIYTNSIPSQSLADVSIPSIGIVETWFHDMDAGWTRYIFDKYNIPYRVIRPAELGDAKIYKELSVIILPNQNADILISGKRKRGDDYYPINLPPEFAKGMGKMGKDLLLQFVNEGGTVLSWGQSTELFMGALELTAGKEKEEFALPIQNITKGLQASGLEIIGAHVSVTKPFLHPLTAGISSTTPIFFSSDNVFATSLPVFDMDRRVILEFPDGDPSLSGYTKNGKLLEHKAAMVWVRKNKGQIVLYAFNPQFRGQTAGTFKLIFNAILLNKL